MNLIYLALLCGLIATSFVRESIAAEARLHAESIVGGAVSPVGQNTYAVSIRMNYVHLCGGGILNNRYVITAAHCFIDLETNKFVNGEYIVLAGVVNTYNKHEPYRVIRDVMKIYIPREYNPIVRKTRFADIAVLELASALGLNHLITNVILPLDARPQLTYANKQAVVCGFGDNWVTRRRDPRTKENVEVCSGRSCFERRCAQVNILSNMACRRFVRDVQDSQLCGSIRQRSPANPEGLCAGDSGSPLVIRNTIIGIVSSSPVGCKEDLEPALYTRVTSFLPFITRAMTGVRTANMRLAQYEVKTKGCGQSCNEKVLVEQ